MKRTIAVIFILFLLPLASAVEFDMKEEFAQGETFMAKISGNFVQPIIEENVFFYRGHVRVPTDFSLARLNDDFYIYAQLLGKEPNNYSLQIKEVEYMQVGQVSEEDLVKNFSINNQTADFSIDPGFLQTDKDFSIKVQNLKDTSITIKINEEVEEGEEKGFFDLLFGREEVGGESVDTIELKSGEIKNIEFSIENSSEATFKFVKLSTGTFEYEIPVYILEGEGELEEEGQASFRFEPTILDISLATESEGERIIYIFNDGDLTIKNISIELSSNLDDLIFASLEEIEELEPNESVKITLDIFSNDNAGEFEGFIRAEADLDLVTSSDIFLNFIPDYIPPEGFEEEEVIDPGIKTCEQMNGTVCGDGEKCEGEKKYASNGECCLEECLGKEETSNGKVLGWTILIVIILFMYWFFTRKYKQPRREVNLSKVARGKRR